MMTRIILALASLAATLGAQVRMDGEWRMRAGDSPQFASEDTSAWTTVTLPWKESPANGFFWLRKTVRLDQPMPQATLVIGKAAAAMQIFINGREVAQTPGLGTNNVELFQPRSFRLPEGLPAGDVEVAIRCWQTNVWWVFAAADHGPYWLAPSPETARAFVDQTWLVERDAVFPRQMLSIAMLFLGLYMLSAWQKDLRWLGLFLIFWGGAWVILAHAVGNPVSWPPLAIQLTFLASGAGWLCYSLAWIRILELPRRPWLYFAVAAAGVDLAWFAYRLMAPEPLPIRGMPTPGILIAAPLAAAAGVRVMLARTHVLAGAIIAVTGIISGLANLPAYQRGALTTIQAGPYAIPMTPFGYLVLTFWLSIYYLRRLAAERADAARLAAEMNSAQSIQRSLLPGEPLVSALGYEAKAAYLPAMEVGGDFYEFADTPQGLLVLAGDVSGKGLQAAMMVALTLGAFRNRRSAEPARVLEELNQALLQRRTSGFVTCVVARFGPGGSVTIASAGHPPASLNGQEIATPAGLPLGIAADADYQPVRLTMRREDTLVLLSDGVVEAASASGDLLGFDRAREMSAGKSAEEIAEAARAWGQNDDITVVTVRRSA